MIFCSRSNISRGKCRPMEVLFKKSIVEIGSPAAILYGNSNKKIIFYSQIYAKELLWKIFPLPLLYFRIRWNRISGCATQLCLLTSYFLVTHVNFALFPFQKPHIKFRLVLFFGKNSFFWVEHEFPFPLSSL